MKLPMFLRTQKKSSNPFHRMNAILRGGGKEESTSPIKKVKGVSDSPTDGNPPVRRKGVKSPRLEREKVQKAYWNISGTISLVVNIILIAIMILLSREYFSLKRLVLGNIVNGLYDNFGKMDEANIQASVPVDDKITVSFPLLINQNTTVTLTQDTTISNARVTLTTGGLNILSAPTNIILPAGTTLPVQLNLVVEVNQEVPVNLDVNVDIPLTETQLHEPFSNLKGIVAPLRESISQSPNRWEDLLVCRGLKAICNWWFR